MKKLLFFDIDGTLAYPGKEPAPSTVEAIRQARGRGHMAFLSTGRTRESIPPAIARIGFDGAVFSAGGEVHLQGQRIASYCMEKAVLEPVVAWLRENRVFYVLETAEGRFCSEHARQVFLEADLSAASREMRELTREILFDPAMRPMGEYGGQGVFKIMYHGPRGLSGRLAPALAGIAKIVPNHDFPGLPISLGEISDPRVHKGRAMEEICRYFAMTTADCIAFGDSMNDGEMLHTAGIGIAMANGDPRLKALADRVCDRCECDGIAKALRELHVI